MHDLYQSCFPAVLSYVTKNRGNREQAEDTYHDAFVAVWRNMQLGRFSPDCEGAFKAYLTRIAKNKWIDFLRSKGFRITGGLDEQMSSADKAGTATDDETDQYLTKVVGAFGKLSAHCRELLAMYYYQDYSMKKIAEKHEWTEATARNNKYRCLQKLRALINNVKN